MGLDWMLHKAKPKPGMGLRFTELNAQLNALPEGDLQFEDFADALKAVSISVFEAIGAPQVGLNPEATTYWRETVYEPRLEHAKSSVGEEWADKVLAMSYNAHLKEAHGMYVAELAKIQGGEASISGIACGPLDFRGKVIGYLDEIPDELQNEAYEDHTADESVDYAERLEPYLEQLGGRHRNDLLAATSWLRFWGELGFGFWAWY